MLCKLSCNVRTSNSKKTLILSFESFLMGVTLDIIKNVSSSISH